MGLFCGCDRHIEHLRMDIAEMARAIRMILKRTDHIQADTELLIGFSRRIVSDQGALAKLMADINKDLKDFADAVGVSLDRIGKDVTEIGEDIDALMAGQVSAETLAALQAVKDRVSGVADALDAVNARNPNAPPVEPPVEPPV